MLEEDTGIPTPDSPNYNEEPDPDDTKGEQTADAVVENFDMLRRDDDASVDNSQDSSANLNFRTNDPPFNEEEELDSTQAMEAISDKFLEKEDENLRKNIQSLADQLLEIVNNENGRVASRDDIVVLTRHHYQYDFKNKSASFLLQISGEPSSTLEGRLNLSWGDTLYLHCYNLTTGAAKEPHIKSANLLKLLAEVFPPYKES